MVSNTVPLNFRPSMARKIRYIAPARDMRPITKLISFNFETINKDTRTIGKSDKIGTKAILAPSLLPYFNVSEIMKVNNGPGVNPPLKPNIIPAVSNEISESGKMYFLIL